MKRLVCAIPWEDGQDFIRSGHRSPDDFEKDSFRTITISAEEGIKAVIGKPKGKDTTEVQSYLFDKSKDWTVDKAKEWFEQHKDQESVKLHERVSAILPFKVLEKIVDKPLKIRGVAITAGMSRNFNIYTPEELQAFANKLVAAPVYVEHVAVPNAIGKVTKTEWDGENLWYEAEVYDEETAEKIRKGLIQHVSVGADYETLDIVDGKVPHGLHNAELSLVAVPGIPETNVQILESLQRAKEQQEICVFCGKNVVEFWLGCCSECFDKLPLAESKKKEMREKAKPCIPASVSASPSTPNGSHGVESLNEEELKKLIEVKVKEALDKRLAEAEWNTEYINDLPDSAFAVIGEGGQKDEQGKTVPRTLRHLPHHNAEGALNLPHLRNALARMNQIEPASLQPEAKKHLCAHAKESDIVSEFCGEEPPKTEEKSPCEKAKEALTERVKALEAQIAELKKPKQDSNVASSLLKNTPKTMSIEETVKILESLLPNPAVERSTMGMQRECQAIRNEIFKLKKMLKSD